MKYLRLLFLASLSMAFQCETPDQAPVENLKLTGLLGSWELQDEIINGNISDMIPRCCEILKFDPDDDITDNKGYLTYTAQGVINSGVFEVDLDNQTILFIDDDNEESIFSFTINDSQESLMIDFDQNGTNYTQTWVSIE